jgi:hypothetical protein
MNDEAAIEDKLQKIANKSDLETAIKSLERRKVLMEEDLKDEFHNVLHSLKPSNILKNTIHEVQESTQLKHNLLKIAIGLSAGYFSRKLVIGKSAGIVKKALGTALQYGITNFVAKKSNGEEENTSSHVKRKNLFKRIFSI